MKRSLRACLGVIAVGSLFAFAGCGDDDDSGNPSSGGKASSAGSGNVGGAPDGGLECQVLGELCHEADTGSGPAHDCHEIGHEGSVAACVKDFASCIHTCVTDADDLGSGGAGSAPDPLCIALGELCHEVDDKTGPLHECHEVGHIGVAAACAKEFDGCATQCLAARELLEAGGAGGGGGVTSAGGAQSAGAAGVAAGGMSAGGVGGAGGSP